MNDRSPTSTGRTLPAALLLIVVTAAVFGQVCGHDFLIWDDDRHVVNNPHLNPPTWRGVGRLWQQPYWGLYIPLSYTFFAAEASIAREPLPDGAEPGQHDGGPNAAVFHGGNLALHIACVLLVFVLLRRLFHHTGAACAGALLFALHPVQVESVAWVSETRGVLCAVFSLLAVWQYVCYAEMPKSRKLAVAHYGMATACFLLALLCKPAAVAVPLIVAAIDVGLLRRRLSQILLVVGPWLIAAAGWVVITKWQQPSQQLPFVPELWARPLLAGDALAFYLLKLAAPWRLGPDYGRSPGWVMQQGMFYVAWMLPVAVLIVLASLPNRRVWLTAAAVSFVWVLPVLGLVPFVFQRISTVADRYLYLAMLGPAMAACWLLGRYWNRPAIVVTATILCALSLLSGWQTTHWRNNQTLIEHGLWVNPRSYVAKQHRGHLLAKDEQHERAIETFREALQYHPTMAELHRSLRISLLMLGKSEEAVEALKEALRRVPNNPDFQVEWGVLMRNRGVPHEAVKYFRKALQIDPNHVEAHVNLGVELIRLGYPDEARRHYERAVEIQPHWPVAHYNLANLFLRQRDFAQAADHYRAALAADPEYLNARINLGLALAAQDRLEEAAAAFRAALQLVPPDSQRAGRLRQLLKQYQR